MANFLTKIVSSGIGSFAQGIANIVDQFTLDKEEKAKFAMELEKLAQAAESELEQTMRAELQAKERILVAELNQGDKYTKRARPTVVYLGLVFISWNYCIVPVCGWVASAWIPELRYVPSLPLPDEFWYAWGGIVATWSIGRTMERRGSNNNLVSMITGNDARKTLLERVDVN